MYAEASAPRKQGDNALLKSFLIAKNTQQLCVTFWYHMSGTNIGILNLYLLQGNGVQTKIWSLSGKCL